MKQLFLYLIMINLIPLSICGEKLNAQNSTFYKDKFINIGIKGGFNSSIFMVSDFKIKDVTIDEVQNNYKLGYFGGVFMRFNMKKHFIQPEVSYNVSKSEITFDKLGTQHPDIEPEYASVQSMIHSIEVPILYGFNIVKENPYSMSLFVGPKFRYLWNKKNKITFIDFNESGVSESLYPLSMSAVIGVGVTISRLFFDFRYEQGLTNISKSVSCGDSQSNATTTSNEIVFNRKESALSFSLGFLF